MHGKTFGDIWNLTLISRELNYELHFNLKVLEDYKLSGTYHLTNEESIGESKALFVKISQSWRFMITDENHKFNSIFTSWIDGILDGWKNFAKPKSGFEQISITLSDETIVKVNKYVFDREHVVRKRS